MTTVKAITAKIEEWVPARFAADWDNVGLQVGAPGELVDTVLVTLDVNESAIERATEDNTDLIVAHHPLIFQPAKRFRWDTGQGNALRQLAQLGCSVYVMHTNLDVVSGGVSDALAEVLLLDGAEVLEPVRSAALYKLVVFVPADQLEQVRKAMGEAGAGSIGNYSHCTFQTPGVGTFLPHEGANPFIGRQGELEFLEEHRLESIVSGPKLSEVIQAVIRAHPYEEPAYDIYRLENEAGVAGFGRVGRLAKGVSLTKFAEATRNVLRAPHVQLLGEHQREVRTVAVCGGAGGSFVHSAAKAGADVYVTGELDYHEAQEAQHLGLAVLLVGHDYSEQPVVPVVAGYLDKHFGSDCRVLFSEGRGHEWSIC